MSLKDSGRKTDSSVHLPLRHPYAWPEGQVKKRQKRKVETAFKGAKRAQGLKKNAPARVRGGLCSEEDKVGRSLQAEPRTRSL